MVHPLLLVFLSKETTSSLAFDFTSPTIRNQVNRRVFLGVVTIPSAYSAITLSRPTAAIADEVRHQNAKDIKPFGPPQALIPITRLKLWVDEAYERSKCTNSIQDADERYRALEGINEILSNRPKLFQGETEPRQTFSSTAQLTTAVSPANKDQYQQNRKNLDLGNKMNAMLNQADVERQWGILQYAERKLEQSNEMRAAFNFYTRQLTYGDEYILTASKEERKKMIRNDELPTLSAVITSDLDQRDLYRNQFLTAIDDAIAESAYQVKLNNREEVDLTDLVDFRLMML